MAEKTLYGRLGGVFAIAAVVNHFSDVNDRHNGATDLAVAVKLDLAPGGDLHRNMLTWDALRHSLKSALSRFK